MNKNFLRLKTPMRVHIYLQYVPNRKPITEKPMSCCYLIEKTCFIIYLTQKKVISSSYNILLIKLKD